MRYGIKTVDMSSHLGRICFVYLICSNSFDRSIFWIRGLFQESSIMQRSQGHQLRGPFSGITSMDEGFTKSNDLFCFTCDNIFPSIAFLEEHCCPAATHICSCGTEFPLYLDVVAHSKTHPPGHSVVDRIAVRKRRFVREQEENLRFSAQQGPSSLLGFNTKPASSLEVSKRQVSLQSSPPNSVRISKLFRGSAAPTVDLWTVYQPVVLIKMPSFRNKGTYRCGKCLQRFSTKSNLVLHYNSHARDKVSGCIGCGVLLSSNKSLPQYHHCYSPCSVLAAGVITTRPVCGQKPNMLPGAQTVLPSNKSKKLDTTAPKMIQMKTYARPHSNLAKKPTQATFTMDAFACGVCHVAFESVKLLQRHKCIEAQKIVLNKPMPRPQSSSTPWRSITALKGPYPLPQTARSKNHRVGPFGVGHAYRNKTVMLSNGTGGQPVSEKTDLDSDDDCYIIESATKKPNKMCLNLSSSLYLEKMNQ